MQLESDLRPLKSLRDLEFRLGVYRKDLRFLAENGEENYSPFQQEKKMKPHQSSLKSTKVRDIDNPSKDLKRVQKKILNKVLRSAKLPHFLFGAVSKRGIVLHAQQHLGATTVVKMDIKSYYPNITCDHVYSVFADVLHCSPRIAALLTQLTTYRWHLPQGAPTSPGIANLFLASIYGPVLAKCADDEIVPTAWVDDLIFSGDKARSIMELVRKTLAQNGLKPHPAKRHILTPRNSIEITGARLGAGRLRVPKEKLHEIRAGIHNFEVGRFTARGKDRDMVALEGQILHIKSICPSDAQPLAAKFRSVRRASSR